MGVSRLNIFVSLLFINYFGGYYYVCAEENAPNITMLYDNNNRIICVASGVTTKSGLTFIADTNEIDSFSEFIYKPTSSDNKYDCDFEKYSCVSTEWNNNNDYIKSDSKYFKFSPILDERWNTFPSFYTIYNNKPKYEKRIDIKETNFHISFSVRANNNAHILLCRNYYPTSSPCYWILIDAFANSLTTAIRKCNKIPADYPRKGDNPECIPHKKNITLSEQLVSFRKWRHFTIARENGNRILLWEMNRGIEPLLNYTDDETSLTINYMLFRGFNSKAEWKVHEYKFIKLQTENRQIKLGPSMQISSNFIKTFSMYVALCFNCFMEITLESNGVNSIVEKKIIQGSNSNYFMEWKYVNFEILINPYLYYQFYVKLSKNENVPDSESFWAIDDFRVENDNEIKVGSVRSMQGLQIFCKSLQYPGWRVATNSQKKKYDDTLECSNPKYIGKYCDVKCSSVFTSNIENCYKNTICLVSMDDNSPCICGSGYKWPSCSQECDSNHYGYNCSNQCGQCYYNGCSKQTGICSSNFCKLGFDPPYCNITIYPKLLFPPQVVQVTYNSILVKLQDTSSEGKEKAVSYQMQYKKEGQQIWQNVGERNQLSDLNEINIDNLEKETDYLIRAILYTADNNTFTEKSHDTIYKIPETKATTLCEVNQNIEFIVGTRNVTINPLATNLSCTLNTYKLLINTDGRIIYEETLKSQNLVQNLQPYTNYEMKVIHKKSSQNIFTKIFTTLEDAPSAIQNLKMFFNSENEISLSWEPPSTPNGHIKRYVIKYQHFNYISCGNRKSENENEIEIDSIREEIFLRDLKPYSKYLVQIAAETIIQGTSVEKYFETKMIEKLSEDELPINLSLQPSSTFVTITWKLPDCQQIKGPLSYRIFITCIKSEWCNITESQTLPDISAFNLNVYSARILVPFTNYQLELKALRTGSEQLFTESIIQEFTTLAGVPPEVRNLTAYSKDDTTISLKWLPPYPPHGELEYYQIAYCYNIYCTPSNFKKIELIPCNFWEENYLCTKLTNLYNNYVYRISIQAKNENIRQSGPQEVIQTKTVQGAPSKPLNLSSIWIDTTLILFWNHPDVTNGPLTKFVVHLKQIDTEIIDKNTDKDYIWNVTVHEPMKQYTKQIEKSVPYSSSYLVTIYGVTIRNGKAANLNINTPPETPELTSQEIKIYDESITNTTIKVKLPSVIERTKSKTSYMYIVVSEINSRTKRETTNSPDPDEIKKEILMHGSASENSWIATETTLNAREIDIIVGDNRETVSNILNETIFNKQLEPDTEYDMSLVLVNLYRNRRSYNSYKIRTVKTAANVIPSNGLYALILLLIIPVVIFFGYRYFKKNQSSPSMSMMPVISSVVRTETSHDPDVIPLTEETLDFKPKRPAVALKPSTSQNSESTTVQLSTSATTFFHSRLIPLNNFEEYLKEALENGELEDQHALFPRGQTKPWDYGMLKQNKFKNRYNNLIAYDKNRVKLEKILNDQFSDYINASYIHGYRQENAYIATQGPKLATVNDFWRMIWQEKVQYIIMLANVVEAGKKKCEKYWPDIETSREYGQIDVFFEKSEIYADYEYRTFTITKNKEQRKITQFHFTSWPDHGVPLYPQSLVPFLKKMLTISCGNAPIVVHCSAGVGRTGTIILCDICLRMAAREGQVDILRFLHEIREQRANMVDNVDQYKLVHMALLECLLAPDTNIPCDANFSNAVQKLIDEGCLQIQLNYLQSSAWQSETLTFPSNKEIEPENHSKNRFPDIIPEKNKIYLSRYPATDEFSDYINAVPVDGFRFKEQFIVTQNPLPNTINDFWRMIIEKTVKIIVSLNVIPENDDTSCIFWPNENEEMNPLSTATLKFLKLQENDNYDIYSIILDDQLSEEENPRTIQLIQFKNWKHGNQLPDNLESLVTLWEESENLTLGNYPMVVTCYDGATACGLFVAMSFVIEKIKLEQQCDACLAVRVIRRNRKQFVANKIQFECLYKTALIYLSMFETYSNFGILNKLRPLDSIYSNVK